MKCRLLPELSSESISSHKLKLDATRNSLLIAYIFNMFSIIQ